MRARGLTASLALLLALPFLVGWRWPGEINRLSREGREAYEAGRYADAVRLYGEAAEGGAPPEVLYGLGTAYLGQNDYAKALETLGRVAERAETDEMRNRVHYNRGNAYYRLGQYEQAADAYRKALEADPEDADAAYNLQLCLDKLKQNPPPQNQQQQQGDQQEQGGGGGGQQNPQEGEQGEEESESSQGQQSEQEQDSDSEQDENQGDGGPPQPGRMPDGRPLPDEQTVDRLLRELERDEQQLRSYFEPRPGDGSAWDDPLGSMYDFERQIEEMTGDSTERDW